MKRALLKFTRIAIINLVLLVLLFEAASLGLYCHHTGRFFYSTGQREKGTLSLPADGESLDEAGPSAIKRTLHPYLGFVYEAHAKRKLQFSTVEYASNNAGLLSPYDYPYRRKSANQFIIGIFGGSVAMYYGFYELENHVLVNMLKPLPYFQDKEIIVLPFASGSYKQPQQLLELNYFTSLGQDFDLVINIDGFNETALAYLNYKAGYDTSMPSVEMFRPLVRLANRGFSANQLALTLEILKLKDDLHASQVTLNDCRFASCYGLTWIKVRYLLRQYQKKAEEFNRLTKDTAGGDSLVLMNKPNPALDEAGALDDMASVWAKSQVAMNRLLNAWRIRYFEVIQPNQYYSTGKKFSESEQQLALNQSSPYADGVIKGYPKLIAQLAGLKTTGVTVINAVNAFDGTSDDVYVDSCCHYNRTGNDLFARFVANQIVESFKTEGTPTRP